MQPTENVSSALLWELTKKNHSFLRRSKNVIFSLDPYNITYRNSKKNSGFIKKKAMNFSMVKGKPRIVTMSADEKGAIEYKTRDEISKASVLDFFDKNIKSKKLKKRLKVKFRRLHNFSKSSKKMENTATKKSVVS